MQEQIDQLAIQIKELKKEVDSLNMEVKKLENKESTKC